MELLDLRRLELPMCSPELEADAPEVVRTLLEACYGADGMLSRLTELGLSDAAVDAVRPRWWSEEAEGSLSARAEFRFSVARRLRIDPRSLFEEQDAPRFLWKGEARFKHLSGEGDLERAGITSFGRAIASALLGATPLRTTPLCARTTPASRCLISATSTSVAFATFSAGGRAEPHK